MFSAARKAVVDSSLWKEKGGDVDFIEAWQFENVEEACDRNFGYGSLEDDQILRWVSNLDWKPLGYPKDKHELVGNIRVIVCERSRYDPLDFPISRSIFEEVEQAFHLHPATLPTFESHAGTFSRYLTFCNDDRTKLKRIAFILKAPQKREIANYGLSLSHDVECHVTTALLYGAEVLIRPESEINTRNVEDRPQRQYENRFEPRPTVPALLDLFRNAIHAWNHPLLLPSILLEHHMHRTRAFTNYGKIIDETVKIERELGVTKVGRNIYSISDGKGKDLRARAEELTVLINTHSTRILFTSRSPDWNLKCSEFKLKLLSQLQPYLPGQHEAHHELKELLEFNLGFAEAAVDDVTSVRERMALQLNVLYNFVAQMDNALNAQLAAAAGRDSTSMKILAFISVIFLPGTFVAGVFSMSMFDWQYSGNNSGSSGGSSGGGGDGVVSERFWIFWVIAVPLTLITLLGWGFWWRVEMRRFKQNFKDVTSDTRKEALELKRKAETESKRPQHVGATGLQEGLV